MQRRRSLLVISRRLFLGARTACSDTRFAFAVPALRGDDACFIFFSRGILRARLAAANFDFNFGHLLISFADRSTLTIDHHDRSDVVANTLSVSERVTATNERTGNEAISLRRQRAQLVTGVLKATYSKQIAACLC